MLPAPLILQAPFVLALLLVIGALPGAALAVEGSRRPVVISCADGSVIFAPRGQDVGCEGAVRMPPGYVPRVASQQDRAAAIAEIEREDELDAQLARVAYQRELAALAAPPEPDPGAQRDLAGPGLRVSLAPREVAALRDLVARGLAPAAAQLALEPDGGPPDRLSLAHAPEFDARLRLGLAALGLELHGPVLVFQLERRSAGTQSPVPGFAQSGVTFHPDPGDPRDFGWIDGDGATPRLGYVVLPAEFEPSRPLVIFWGDDVAATAPQSGTK